MDKKTDKSSKSTMLGISLYETEMDIVRAENERLGMRNFSATLRMIIREWALFTFRNRGNDKNKEEG